MSTLAYRVRRAVQGLPTLEMAGLSITADMQTVLGEPPAELLGRDDLVLDDCAGNAWPSSFRDADGTMQRARDSGAWPSAKVLHAMERAAAKATGR